MFTRKILCGWSLKYFFVVAFLCAMMMEKKERNGKIWAMKRKRWKVRDRVIFFSFWTQHKNWCEPQIHLWNESKRIFTFYATSCAIWGPRLTWEQLSLGELSSSWVQCMIAKYLIIRFQVNVSINYWILLPPLREKPFYDFISFSIIFVVWNKLRFCCFLLSLQTILRCKTSTMER